MKKFFLTIGLFVALISANAQEVVINEIYPDPSTGNEEYIELYNTTGSPINLDCYTLVSYYNIGSGGAWVFQLPNVIIPAFGHVVFGTSTPLSHQGGTYGGANQYSWNAIDATQSLTNYSRSGNNLVYPPAGPATANDIIPITGGNSSALAIMLFKPNGNLTNAFFANNSGGIPVSITSLSDLNIDLGGACGVVNLNFSGISAPEAEVFDLNAAPGTDNGFRRTRDGFCGTWEKNEPANTYSPGQPNSNLPPINTSTSILPVALEVACGNAGINGNKSTWNLAVTVSDATLLPATFRIYQDNDYSGGLTIGDAILHQGTVTTTTQMSFPGTLVQKGSGVIFQVITASGCIQITSYFSTQCSVLPVSYKSFTATRNHSNVLLKWETATELNNTGFMVQRNIGGSWEDVAFVPSMATNGNSEAILTYLFSDPNTNKGITQYRLEQVDLDGKSKLSQIRAVRGEGQIGKTIVFPNPSTTGNLNIVFEDANVKRDVSVIDMSGKVIRQWRNVTNNNLQLENLPSGVFSVRILAIETGEQVVEKIIVNRH